MIHGYVGIFIDPETYESSHFRVVFFALIKGFSLEILWNKTTLRHNKNQSQCRNNNKTRRLRLKNPPATLAGIPYEADSSENKKTLSYSYFSWAERFSKHPLSLPRASRMWVYVEAAYARKRIRNDVCGGVRRAAFLRPGAYR